MNERRRQITVAHVVQNLDVGGLEQIVIHLMTLADPSRFRSVLYCLEDGGTLLKHVTGAGHRARTLGKKDGVSLLLPFTVARSLQKDRVDIVNCHHFGGLLYGGLGGRLAGISGIVYTVHTDKIPTRPRQLMIQRMPIASRVISVSDNVRQAVIDKVGIEPERVQTIINGIDMEKFSNGNHRAALRSELGVSEGTIVIGVVARLDPAKDHHTLITAFKQVVKAHDNVHLVIVGDGELRNELVEKVGGSELTGHVSFLGARDDVHRLLHAFDVFALSSRQEGFGIALLEAMAARLPVVATSTGGIPEIVVDGETGIMVSPQNADEFADGLKWMITHPEKARMMGEAGRDRVAAHFGIRRMVEKYEGVYSELTMGRYIK